MTQRGSQLNATADQQIAELIALISTIDEAALRLPCPARETLGDGTVAASLRHTADNYQRIADFLHTSDPGLDGDLISRMLSWGEGTLRSHVTTEEVSRGAGSARDPSCP